MTHPLTAVLCGVVGLGSGVAVPLLVRRLPPVEVEDGDPVPVSAVADRAGLRWRSVVVCGVAAALIGLATGWTWPLLYLLPLVPVLVALAVVDWHTRILPSRLIYPAYLLVVVGVLASWLLAGRPDGWSALGRTVVGGVLVFALFYLAWFVYPRGMGFGDVRLSGLLGLGLAYLGWRELVVGLYAGFLLGGVIGGVLSLARVVERRGYPFGPFLVTGALAGVVLGRPVMDLFSP